MASNIIEFVERFLAPKLSALEVDANNLKTQIDDLRQEDRKLSQEIKRLEERDIEIIERLVRLETRMDSLARETWLRLENTYLRRQKINQDHTLLDE